MRKLSVNSRGVTLDAEAGEPEQQQSVQVPNGLGGQCLFEDPVEPLTAERPAKLGPNNELGAKLDKRNPECPNGIDCVLPTIFLGKKGKQGTQLWFLFPSVMSRGLKLRVQDDEQPPRRPSGVGRREGREALV